MLNDSLMTYFSVTRFLRMSLLLMACVLTATSGRAQILINEYSCSNMATIIDAYGQHEDWVELYNPTANPVNIGGWWMSDNFTGLQKWQVPAGFTIPANGKRMVFCSGRGTVISNQLHPSFKLTQTHWEKFALTNASGIIEDSVTLLLTQKENSRGRSTDGAATWSVFDIPTPNAANGNGRTAYEPKVMFSVAPGFYTAAQSVSLSCTDATAQIRYTVNGSQPTATSTLYTGAPVSAAVTTLIRARAFPTNTALLPSFVESNTYFINETLSPTMNVISLGGAYTTMFSGWSASSNNLFGSFEFFDKGHNFKFDLEGEARPHGNDSWAYPQKGFRFYARDELGYRASMDYKFFNNSPRDTFKTIILKAGASDNYPGNSGSPSCHLRDAFVHTLCMKNGVDVDGRRYEPTVVFINGVYWGIYEIRERVDDDFTEYYYGQKKDDIDMLRYWGGMIIDAGSDTAWNNLYSFVMANNMATPANYQHVTDRLDVKSLIDYFVVNTYLVNTDWLNWNTMWWRGRKGTGVKWRYAFWDEDNVLGLGQNYTGVQTPTYQNSPCNPFTLFQNNSTIKHTDMLVHLMANPTFKQFYRDRFIELLNSPLSCDIMIPHLDSMLAIIDPEMQRHCTRWNGNYNTWQAHVTYLKAQINGRCTVIDQKLDSCMGLSPQTLAVAVFPAGTGSVKMGATTLNPIPWKKVMTGDSTYQLKATATQPYYSFDHWEKTSLANFWTPDSLQDNVAFRLNKKDSVIAVFRYLNTDSVAVTFLVTPPGSGNISLQGAALSAYPHTVILDRRQQYNLGALALSGFNFAAWSAGNANTVLTPTLTAPYVKLSYQMADTIVAHFDAIPPPPPPPPVIPIDEAITFPTAFSPNGDGRNEWFGAIGGKDVDKIEIRVFNRWGEMVWHGFNKGEHWDGSIHGKPAPIGTYFFTASVHFDNGQLQASKEMKGEVTVIR